MHHTHMHCCMPSCTSIFAAAQACNLQLPRPTSHNCPKQSWPSSSQSLLLALPPGQQVIAAPKQSCTQAANHFSAHFLHTCLSCSCVALIGKMFEACPSSSQSFIINRGGTMEPHGCIFASIQDFWSCVKLLALPLFPLFAGGMSSCTSGSSFFCAL